MARTAGSKLIPCVNPATGKKACGKKIIVNPGTWKVCPHCGFKFRVTKKLIAALKTQ